MNLHNKNIQFNIIFYLLHVSDVMYRQHTQYCIGGVLAFHQDLAFSAKEVIEYGEYYLNLTSCEKIQ